MRMLVVCNEPSFRVVLSELLCGEGHDIDVSRDVRSAQRRLRAGRYDLVILNLLETPDPTLSACQSLRQIRREQKIAYVFGPWSSVPPDSCPDFLIPLDAAPSKLVARLEALAGMPAGGYQRAQAPAEIRDLG
jgi:CheY-like chemotaxis protein